MWRSYFHQVFDDIEAELDVVLYANNCREGWLQGEFYRRSPDGDFKVNAYRYESSRKVADLSGERPTGCDPVAPMVAEMKIIGGNYMSKCLDGRGHLDRYVAGEDGLFRPTQAQIDKATGFSLLTDVKRVQQVPDRIRYLLLVRPYDGAEQLLGRILTHLRLPGELDVWPYKHFDVRVWTIPYQAR